MAEHEFLMIRGRLDRLGRFTPRRCKSTPYVHAWPEGTGSADLARIGAGGGAVSGRGEVLVELVGPDGDVLQREVAQVRSELVCAPGEETFRVLAYIGLDPRAEAVQVRRDERVLWHMRIPPSPRVDVRLEQAPERPSRREAPTDEQSQRDADRPKRRPKGTDEAAGRRAVLSLETDEPADEETAFVSVVYQWAERGFRSVHLGPLARTIELPVERLPGSKEGRFLVTYSNGLRASSAATETFELPPLGVSVSIQAPPDGAELPGGAPVVLEGLADDVEHPGMVRELSTDDERLVWTVDGQEVAVGTLTSVNGLEPGRHQIALAYRGESQAQATVTVTVTTPAVAPADQWPEWELIERP